LAAVRPRKRNEATQGSRRNKRQFQLKRGFSRSFKHDFPMLMGGCEASRLRSFVAFYMFKKILIANRGEIALRVLCA
jgi:hypothetical protein